jgi:hypothetical protein
MNINTRKVLSNASLLSLKGGVLGEVWCCVYDENDVEQYRGISTTGSCEGAAIPPEWSSRECDDD